MKSFWGRPAQMLLLPVLLVVSRSAARAEEPLDTGRIREIAAMLPVHARWFRPAQLPTAPRGKSSPPATRS